MTDAAGACAIAINYGRATDRRIIREEVYATTEEAEEIAEPALLR